MRTQCLALSSRIAHAPRASSSAWVTRAAFRLGFALAFVFTLSGSMAQAQAKPGPANSSYYQTEHVSGIVITEGHTDSGDVWLVSKRSPEPLKVVAHPSILSDLRKLSSGDFVVGRGTIQVQQKTARLESIETLGLRQLLGSWKSSRWEVYEFRDFNRMTLYIPAVRNYSLAIAVPLKKAQEFSYFLAPEQDNRYSIFLMAEDKTITTGSIEVQDGRIQLSVIDSQTGEIRENISLSPLSVQ